MESKAYDRLVIELQKEGEAVVSVALDMKEVAFLEEVRGVPMRDHVANMVEVLVDGAEKAAAARGAAV